MINHKCVNIVASKKDTNIHILVNNKLEDINIHTQDLNSGFLLKTNNLGDNIIIDVTQENIKIRCTEICHIEDKEKIKIIPEYLFLANGNNFVDDVYIITSVMWEAN
jgi:hypothetical protein